MAIGRDVFIDVLKDSYSAYYDILPPNDSELPMVFRADYRKRDETYWFTKSVPVWGNETNEYVYVFSAPQFDAALADKCMEYALADGLPRVKPHKEHQYTNIKVLLIADQWGEDAVKVVKKKSFSKSYKFSLHGFSTLHAAAVDISQNKAYTNKAGYQLADYFKKLFASREEKP